MQVNRPRHPGQDDIADLDPGRVNRGDPHQLSAADQRHHGGAEPAAALAAITSKTVIAARMTKDSPPGNQICGAPQPSAHSVVSAPCPGAGPGPGQAR